MSERQFAVRYWDDSLESPDAEPRFTIVIRSPSALRRMLMPPSELSIAEAYLFDDIDVEGDIESAAELGDLAVRRIASPGTALHLFRLLLALPCPRRDDRAAGSRAARHLARLGHRHSERRDAHVVRFHYDIGNDFYALWLDRQMVYSCAYFKRDDLSLDEAQSAKLDLVCRKLRLRAGERFLDIGCGWGALIIHAARHYGVRARGITLSERQAAYARARIDELGLSASVDVVIRDYRKLGVERFDKIASVGMVEHVGEGKLSEYFAAVYNVLEPGGLFLNHGIVSIEDSRPRRLLDPIWRPLWRRDEFIYRYVFPDGLLVASPIVLAAAEQVGFELRDVESLREHYVRTLRQWVRRLQQHEVDARAIVGDLTYRVWRLYMSAAAHGFAIGRIGVIQTLLAKPDPSGKVHLPPTRADIYAV